MGRHKKVESLPVINPHAAGIDVGSRSHFVAIGQGADEVREFGVYSSNLHALCQWLKEEAVQTVALESTGSYWQNLFILLQDYGLNPILVSGKFTKNVQGKKTDVLDCHGFTACIVWVYYPILINPMGQLKNCVSIVGSVNL